jgi:hypothetical protein
LTTSANGRTLPNFQLMMTRLLTSKTTNNF